MTQICAPLLPMTPTRLTDWGPHGLLACSSSPPVVYLPCLLLLCLFSLLLACHLNPFQLNGEDSECAKGAEKGRPDPYARMPIGVKKFLPTTRAAGSQPFRCLARTSMTRRALVKLCAEKLRVGSLAVGVWPLNGLEFPNAVVLNAVVFAEARKSERKRACKCPQKSANANVRKRAHGRAAGAENSLSDFQENPHAHRNKIGTPPPKWGGIWHWAAKFTIRFLSKCTLETRMLVSWAPLSTPRKHDKSNGAEDATRFRFLSEDNLAKLIYVGDMHKGV